MTKEVPLTQGKFALVDDEDYERVMMYKWYASKTTSRLRLIRNKWYAERKEGKKTVYLHRFILDAESGEECDHRNGNGFDERRCNLRIVTHQQNNWNRQKTTSRLGIPASSKYKGVHWRKDRNKWRARININCKRIHLGTFDSEEEAARAYDDKAIELHGEYAKINIG